MRTISLCLRLHRLPLIRPAPARVSVSMPLRLPVLVPVPVLVPFPVRSLSFRFQFRRRPPSCTHHPLSRPLHPCCRSRQQRRRHYRRHHRHRHLYLRWRHRLNRHRHRHRHHHRCRAKSLARWRPRRLNPRPHLPSHPLHPPLPLHVRPISISTTRCSTSPHTSRPQRLPRRFPRCRHMQSAPMRALRSHCHWRQPRHAARYQSQKQRAPPLNFPPLPLRPPRFPRPRKRPVCNAVSTPSLPPSLRMPQQARMRMRLIRTTITAATPSATSRGSKGSECLESVRAARLRRVENTIFIRIPTHSRHLFLRLCKKCMRIERRVRVSKTTGTRLTR